jgi:putative ABC transport system ATP-binding protein
MLLINNLVKTFSTDAAPLLNNINLQVEQGQSVSIQGASGCGKSTLLSLIAGFDSVTSGLISIGGLQITPNATTHGQTKAELATPEPTQKSARKVQSKKALDNFRKNHLGIVFQSYNLFDCFNAWDNIAFTARLKGNYDSAFQRTLMQQLNISDLARKPLSDLSGGEQQRCAIARALVHRPSLVLADEPTGNLDEATSEFVSALLFDTCKTTNTSLIVVTHSSDVAALADKPMYLHQGKLLDAKHQRLLSV